MHSDPLAAYKFARIDPQFGALRAAVHSILRNRIDYTWTVQGFGMLRTYLDAEKKYRLNIWDSALAVNDVSVIHDHPWSFTSWVMSGRFYNIRFDEQFGSSFVTHNYAMIKTGEGGGPDGKRGAVHLSQRRMEIYAPGDTYEQRASEIHMSAYRNGSVTLNDRTRVGDGEHARVFWHLNEEWVDAEPRPATRDEIERTISCALENWNG